MKSSTKEFILDSVFLGGAIALALLIIVGIGTVAIDPKNGTAPFIPAFINGIKIIVTFIGGVFILGAVPMSFFYAYDKASEWRA